VERISSLYNNPPFYRIIKTDVAVRLVNAIFFIAMSLGFRNGFKLPCWKIVSLMKAVM